jgi:cytochrome c553
MGRYQPAGSRRVFIHSTVILALLCGQPAALIAAQPDLAAARTRAAQIFQNRCGDCHDSPGDSESIFGDGWLPCEQLDPTTHKCPDQPLPNAPRSAALLDKVSKAINYQTGARPMPPYKHGQPAKLGADELAALNTWLQAETDAINHPPPPPPVVTNPVTPVHPPSAPTPSEPVCKVLTSAPTAAAAHPVISDAEAAAIMERSCASCHAHVGQLTQYDKGMIAAGLTSGLLLGLLKWRAHRAQNPIPAPLREADQTPVGQAGVGRMCSVILRRMVRSPLTTMAGFTLAMSSLGFAGSQFAKFAHGPKYDFENGDGSLDPRSFTPGQKDVSLSLLHAEVASGKMPMVSDALPSWVFTPSDANRTKLADWLRQKRAAHLTAGCQVLAVTDAKPFDQAMSQCNQSGMTVPTGAQVAQLAAQAPQLFPAADCVWTSSFSSNPDAPRQAWQNGKLTDEGMAASCKSVCLQ